MSEDPTPAWPAFSRFGVELEYMIVDRESLRVRPIADRLLGAGPGEGSEETERAMGSLHWSNELVRHVLEFKNSVPVPDLLPLDEAFAQAVSEANQLLEPMGAMLLPSGVHPDFRPESETQLWPFGQREIYQRFDSIFGCKGHGWSNLQSTHLNLAFGNEAEFVRLHAAIRLILPLLPGLAASSPILEGQPTGLASSRLHAYLGNCSRLPVITGDCIPEPIHSIQEYEERIYQPIAQAVAPWNSDNLLEPVWVNARGAIARFDRGSIEIRLLDLQECPAQDMNLVRLVVALTRALYESQRTNEELLAVPQELLVSLLHESIRYGSKASISSDYAKALLPESSGSHTLPQLCHALLQSSSTPTDQGARNFLQLLERHGTLAERMLRQFKQSPDWRELARALARSLQQNTPLGISN